MQANQSTNIKNETIYLRACEPTLLLRNIADKQDMKTASLMMGMKSATPYEVLLRNMKDNNRLIVATVTVK